MNFALDPDTLEMKKTAEAFARAHLRTGGEGPFSRERWALCGRQGLLGVTVPAEHGGAGQGAVTAAAVVEALGRGADDLGFVFSIAAHVFAGAMPIVKFGSDEQRARYLPALCAGERIAAHAITEPNAGSDAMSLETRAERRGDGYVLHGTKCFTTNAPVADVFLVHAATRPGGGYFGISAFLVDRETPGLRVGAPYDKVGLRGSPTADVYLDECFVPAAARLGGEGAGASVFAHSMNWERTCLFALYVGAMDRQLEATIAQASQREQFGGPIGRFQAISHRVVDMKLRLEAARLLLYRAAWGLDHDPSDTIAPALAKLAVSEAAVQNSLDALQIGGGAAMMSGEIERLLRDAVPSRVFSGTNEIQRNNVARALGLGDSRKGARR
jgi:alkylation response protein AidB-like acyl-CoA dehydrogenase